MGMGDNAVIFDMDGVLVDSEPVILAAAIKGLEEFHVHAKPEDFTPFIGAGEDRFIGGVAEKYGVPYKPEMKARVYQIYLEIVPHTLKVYPGTKTLLERLKGDGFDMALASSADFIKIKANLEVAGISPGFFKVILSGEDVVQKKPSPDIYLSTARKLQRPPQSCIVIEDALNGVKAAKAAGMKCIGIATSFGSGQLYEAGADIVCNDISDVYGALMKISGQS